MDCEDLGVALIRYDNGAVTLLETSYDYNGENIGETAVFGTKGGVELGETANFYTTMNDRLVDVTPIPNGNARFLFDEEMQHFVDCILEGKECKAPAEDGIWVMKILDAIYESAATGHEVLIK